MAVAEVIQVFAHGFHRRAHHLRQFAQRPRALAQEIRKQLPAGMAEGSRGTARRRRRLRGFRRRRVAGVV
jgi:hypothetical protein